MNKRKEEIKPIKTGYVFLTESKIGIFPLILTKVIVEKEWETTLFVNIPEYKMHDYFLRKHVFRTKKEAKEYLRKSADSV